MLKPILAVMATFVVGMVVPFMSEATDIPLQTPFTADIAYAACGTASVCDPSDPTETSVLEVTHALVVGQTQTRAEPDNGETWQITAYWATAAAATCSCLEHSAQVTADVTWSGSAWSVSCTGCNPTAGPIRSVSICDVDSCSSGGSTHSWVYKLIVDIDHMQSLSCLSPPLKPTYLARVQYETTTVDDGNVISGNCTEGSAGTPTSQTFTATDNGSFECSFVCSATGPSVTITYQ